MNATQSEYTLIADADLRAKLDGLAHQSTILDEAGQFYGMFIPADVYRQLLALIPNPHSQEEMQRRRSETGGSSLAEFWKRMGVECLHGGLDSDGS